MKSMVLRNSVPKVSVIMPVYNGAQFVGEAINSLVLQTWQDWELIIVDDGSTDATPHILDSFHDPRITKVRQPNGGEAAARNAGLDRATGEYLAFLDADDLYLPNALNDLISYMDAHYSTDIVFSDGYICDKYRNPLMRLSEHRPGIYTGFILEPLILSPGVITVPVCTMVRRCAVGVRNVRFDKALSFGVDWDFWIQLAQYSLFGYLDKVTCIYRIHETNMTRTSTRKKRRNELAAVRWKVLGTSWFGSLSINTRAAFFYDLLINLLSGEPERQIQLIESVPFQDLPSTERARLLRLVAGDHILQDRGSAFALYCLEQALASFPQDFKGRFLDKLFRFSPASCRTILSAWRTLHKASKIVSSNGYKGKPVPSDLAPVND